jgi:hypothetical protein
MKPSALRIERMLEKIEAKLVPPERKWLSAIIHEGDAEAVVKEKKEKALAEHVARHPEDVGRTVEDFKWIIREIVSWGQMSRESAGGPAITGEPLGAEPPGDKAESDGDAIHG